jgi:hypothetical protein
VSRRDKRTGRAKYTGRVSEDIERAIYGDFAGHRCLDDVRRAMGLGFVIHEGEWSPRENEHKVEMEKTRASLRVGKHLAGALRRGDVEELSRVANMARSFKASRYKALDPAAHEILSAVKEWWRKNRGEPTPRNILFLMNRLRLKLGAPNIEISLGALTMKMRRIGVVLKGRKQRIRKRTG